MQAKAIKHIGHLERFSKLLDSQFRLPGTRFKFGIDPVIGLVPYAGDLITTLMSTSMLLMMWRHGASGRVMILMAFNIIADTVIGSIPFLGAIFDFFFKSNKRNLQLLKEHYMEGKHQGSGIGLLVLLIGIIVLFLVAVIYGGIKLTSYLWGLL